MSDGIILGQSTIVLQLARPDDIALFERDNTTNEK